MDPTGALHPAPGPQAARLARVALFDFLFLINGAPNHPLPTGTLKQSYATEFIIAIIKLLAAFVNINFNVSTKSLF